jgi:hypothetical protein
MAFLLLLLLLLVMSSLSHSGRKLLWLYHAARHSSITLLLLLLVVETVLRLPCCTHPVNGMHGYFRQSGVIACRLLLLLLSLVGLRSTLHGGKQLPEVVGIFVAYNAAEHLLLLLLLCLSCVTATCGAGHRYVAE